MVPTRLKSKKELTARRLGYELDTFWPPDANHIRVTEDVFAQHQETGGATAKVRNFADAPAEVQRLIDPSWKPVAPKL